MHKKLILLLFLVSLGWTTSGVAGELPEMLSIYDDYVIALSAGYKCLEGDKKTFNKFKINYNEIYLLALHDLKLKNPHNSHDENKTILSKRFLNVSKKTLLIIGDEGCSGATVGKFLDRYKSFADWDVKKVIQGRK